MSRERLSVGGLVPAKSGWAPVGLPNFSAREISGIDHTKSDSYNRLSWSFLHDKVVFSPFITYTIPIDLTQEDKPVSMTIKLSDGLINEAKRYAAVYSRSIPKQIEYWSRIGKIAEENPDLPYSFIQQILLAQQEESEPFNFSQD